VRRWYREARAGAGREDGAGFTVLLDGKGIRTPAKAPLVLPTAGLAEAVAAEWAAQGEELAADGLPLTRLANTAIDLDEARRTAIIDTLAAYARTDLLCYRADAPPALAERQSRSWQPLLDWAALRYDAVLIPVTGIMPVARPESAYRALRAAVAALDGWRLVALQEATTVAGSLVLGLALIEHRIDAETTFALSVLDETWQIEHWGEDAEAAARRAGQRADLAAIARFLYLLEAPMEGAPAGTPAVVD